MKCRNVTRRGALFILRTINGCLQRRDRARAERIARAWLPVLLTVSYRMGIIPSNHCVPQSLCVAHARAMLMRLARIL